MKGCFGAMTVLVLAGSAHAKEREVMASGSADGSVWSQTASGVTAVPVRVEVKCVETVHPSRANDLQWECASTMVVSKDGKVIAKAKVDGLATVHDGSHTGELSVELVDVGGGGLIKLVTRTWEQGNYRRTVLQDAAYLMLVDSKLVEVYTVRESDELESWDPRDTFKKETHRSVTVGNGVTKRMRNLIVNGDAKPVVLAWTGSTYEACSCVDLPPPAVAAAAATPVPSTPAPSTPAVSAPASSTPPDLIDNVTKQSFEPVLAAVLAGKAIDASALASLSDDTLIKLRNAPYARHGRAFKLKVLQMFFYATRDGAAKTALLPRTVDPAFKDSMLDATDLANVRAVVAEQDRRKAK